MKNSLSEKSAAVFIAALTLGFQPAWAIGLAARFGEVVVENAQIGHTYNLRETLKLPFGIENRSDVETEVTVEFEATDAKMVAKGYEPIPNPSWLKAIPSKIRIGPRSQGFFDLLLEVPNDPSLNGRHFQAIVKARTMNTGLLGVAIENTLRFSVGPGPEALKEERKKKAMAKLDFDVSPQEIYVIEVEAGRAFDVKKNQGKSVRVANFASDPLAVKLVSEMWDTRLYLPPGYEAIPDPSWLTFKAPEQSVESEEIGMFQLVITVPDDEKFKGKKYAALIRTGLSTGFWLDAPVRVYFSTKP